MYPTFGNHGLITPYGATFVAALLACWWLARRNAPAAGLEPSHIDLLVPLTALCGVVAASVLWADGPRVGLIGVLLSGTMVTAIYSRAARVSFLALLDSLAVPMVAALAIHRIGCFLAGCCWGDVAAFGGVQFPPGSFAFEQHLWAGLIDAQATASLAVHPVQLYESAILAALALGAQRIPRHLYGRGVIVAAVAGSYGVIRFLIEFLRADDSAVIGTSASVQMICLALAAIGLVVLWQLRVRTKLGSEP